MKKNFPPEILNLTMESHFYKFSKSSALIYISALLLITGAIISLFFVKTKISVQSTGLIRSVSEPIDITSPVVAEVLRTNIAENKFISEGDTLIWLNNEKLRERFEHLQNLILRNEDYQIDLNLMAEFKYASLKTELYKSVRTQYQQRLTEYNLEIDLLKKSYNRTLLLFEKNVIPLTEKEEQEFQLEKAVEGKNLFVKQSLSEWQQLAAEYKLANDNYKNEINELLKDFESYFILSPCTGYITNFNGIQPGSFVTTGQVIAVISPEDQVISEHLVPPKDIGYLKNKMPVVFQVDAYNYNQWGVGFGRNIRYFKRDLPGK